MQAFDGEFVVIGRDGLLLWARPDEIAGTGGATTHLGAAVTIQLPKELLRASPGFYVALGDLELRPPEQEPIVRVYWNVAANAAPQLMRSATTKLNRAGIPFRCKMISTAEGYTRCDSAVLYLPKRSYPSAESIIFELHRELRDGMGYAVPALTKRLAPGLGIAEDPANGNSFGMHRCHYVAEGIIRARESRMRSIHKRLTAVLDCFSEAGIDADHPYLNSGSMDTYLPLTVG